MTHLRAKICLISKLLNTGQYLKCKSNSSKHFRVMLSKQTGEAEGAVWHISGGAEVCCVWIIYRVPHRESGGCKVSYTSKSCQPDENSPNNFPSVSNSESGLLHLWFFQTVPTCLIDTYSSEEAGNRNLGLSPTPSVIADLQRHIFLKGSKHWGIISLAGPSTPHTASVSGDLIVQNFLPIISPQHYNRRGLRPERVCSDFYARLAVWAEKKKLPFLSSLC